ncbi:hypothetical protein JKF63_04256 [Porcisia hertigi]|uniref:Uncharacterized protein n=1 Tax=Porcisia hertigi TaxID=2761500 RepID=A0A836IS59_9TRYP|nr:hypothetical protein JKF63_04256 [Porcisia hertigi]
MFRRSWLRLISLTEAQRLVLDAPGQRASTPRASLSEILTALTEHYRDGSEAFTKAALQHVVQLDQSNEDTMHIADARVAAPSPSNHLLTDKVGVEPQAAAAPPKTPPHLITELLRAYPHTPEIRERCCRCIANMCQLSADAAGSTQLTAVSTPGAALACSTPHLSSALVEEGAVELVLGTLAMASRLSPKGRSWAAMAMLNLTCMSHNGAARATAAGAVDRLAEFVLFLLSVESTASTASTAASIRGIGEETIIALDAALGALTGVLAAEAPENASGISFNYEATSYVAVDAVVRSLLLVSALMVRDGRNDGAQAASLSSRRYGTVHFANATEVQQTAVVVLLPLLHKGWMALQSVCSCATNLPMVFDVIYEAANANQESMVVSNEVDGSTEEVLQVTRRTERQYVAALSSLIDAALFVTTELEGLEAIGADNLAHLQGDVQLYVMGAMQAMTASRKDLARKGATTAAPVKAVCAGEDVEEEHQGNTAGDVTGVYPTEAALNVTDVLTEGAVSNIALACAIRLHTGHQERCSRNQQHNNCGVHSAHSTRLRSVPPPYTAADFTLLSKSLVVLANLAEAGDETATSANAVAALQVILQDAVEGVVSLPPKYEAELAELFQPTEKREDNAETRDSSVILSEDRLSFLQQGALVGQVYAVLWSTLRTAHGVTSVSQMSVMQSAKEVQASLRMSYLPALDVAKQRFGASPATATGDQGTKSDTSRWVANTAEETVTRLLKLSDELVGTMETLSASSRNTQRCDVCV